MDYYQDFENPKISENIRLTRDLKQIWTFRTYTVYNLNIIYRKFIQVLKIPVEHESQ